MVGDALGSTPFYSIFGLPTIFSHPKWLAHKHEN
jgi:hypothetical protein